MVRNKLIIVRIVYVKWSGNYINIQILVFCNENRVINLVVDFIFMLIYKDCKFLVKVFLFVI